MKSTITRNPILIVEKTRLGNAGDLRASEDKLEAERRARRAAEEAKEKAEADRARLQRARDELATSLLVIC